MPTKQDAALQMTEKLTKKSEKKFCDSIDFGSRCGKIYTRDGGWTFRRCDYRKDIRDYGLHSPKGSSEPSLSRSSPWSIRLISRWLRVENRSWGAGVDLWGVDDIQ
jgi:hypothetical protein